MVEEINKKKDERGDQIKSAKIIDPSDDNKIFYTWSILQNLPKSNQIGIINARMASSILGSSASISDVAIQQYNRHMEMNKELNKMKKLLDEKKEYIEFKEENVRKLKSYIVKLEINMTQLAEENMKLKMYNQGTQDTIKLYTSNQQTINISNSANAEQSQIQQQSQSIDLLMYRELIEKVNTIEKEMQDEPKKYEQIIELKQLKDMLNAFKTNDQNAINRGFLKKIVDSDIFKALTNSDNVVKISSTLCKFLDMIQKLNGG